MPVTPEPSSQQSRSPLHGLLSAHWQPSSPHAPAEAPGSLQLPEPLQKPLQQGSHPLLHEQSSGQRSPSATQMLPGGGSPQTPEALQNPLQQELQLAPSTQSSVQAAPSATHRLPGGSSPQTPVELQ